MLILFCGLTSKLSRGQPAKRVGRRLQRLVSPIDVDWLAEGLLVSRIWKLSPELLAGILVDWAQNIVHLVPGSTGDKF